MPGGRTDGDAEQGTLGRCGRRWAVAVALVVSTVWYSHQMPENTKGQRMRIRLEDNSFVAGHDGSKVHMAVPRAGVVRLTTPGNRQLLVRHMPFYADCEAHVAAEGDVTLVRDHITYRYGHQDDASSANKCEGVAR